MRSARALVIVAGLVIATTSHAIAQDGLLERVRMSVVTIAVTGKKPDGSGRREVGTGFFVDRAGHILTSAHVVGTVADWSVDPNTQQVDRRIDVYGLDSNDLRVPYTTAQSAVVVYVDSQSDLALLRVIGRNFRPLRMGRSLEVTGNDSLSAVAYGTRALPVRLPATVLLPFDPSVVGGFMRLIAGVQGGDSGAPVLNSRGEFVAVVTGGTATRPLANEAFATPSHLAANLMRLTGESSDNVPVGTILPFYGVAGDVPDGFLLADGSEFRRDDYPELYQILTRANQTLNIDPTRAKLPDLRGEFLRGYDAGRRVDLGRILGSAQGDEFKQHNHTIQGDVQFHVGAGNGGFAGASGSSDNNVRDPKVTSAGGEETRPRNVAVNFIVCAR
jgi:hypothetical protein